MEVLSSYPLEVLVASYLEVASCFLRNATEVALEVARAMWLSLSLPPSRSHGRSRAAQHSPLLVATWPLPPSLNENRWFPLDVAAWQLYISKPPSDESRSMHAPLPMEMICPPALAALIFHCWSLRPAAHGCSSSAGVPDAASLSFPTVTQSAERSADAPVGTAVFFAERGAESVKYVRGSESICEQDSRKM